MDDGAQEIEDYSDSIPQENEPNLETPDIVSEKELGAFETFGHIALIGPTESGKTTRFKIFCCDQKFDSRENSEFIYVGPPKQLEEIAKSWCGDLMLSGQDYKKGKMQYFKLEEMDKAMLYCTNGANSHKKLLFLDDALVISSQLSKKISTWIHQAKNYNTTVVVSVHEAFGSQNEKMVRSACRYFVGINLQPAQASKLLNLPMDNLLIKNLESEVNPYKNLFIFDKKTQTIYNENYKQFNAVSNE